MTLRAFVGHSPPVKTPPHHRDKIAQRLRATRTALGLNARALCQAVELGESTYSQWERGLRFPEVLQMLPLCDRFGLTLDWIYRGHIGGLSYDLAEKIKAILSTMPDAEDQSDC